jgi:carbonic anhydrase
MTIPEDLNRGYAIFRQTRYLEEAERFRALAAGQLPETMVIGCADSRVDPATIFTASPGELFVVRNVAALVPPCEETGTYHGTSAAVEFAVTQLGVRRIVVLGHGQCGGVSAALAAGEQKPVGRYILPWVELLADMRDTLLDGSAGKDASFRQQALEHMAVQQSLENLQTFPFVADAVRSGTLALHGAWFSIAQGELNWLDRDTGVFSPVAVPISPE